MKLFLIHLNESYRGCIDEAYFIVSEISIEDAKVHASKLSAGWGIDVYDVTEIVLGLGEEIHITSRYC
jgi:hypothetical protein